MGIVLSQLVIELALEEGILGFHSIYQGETLLMSLQRSGIIANGCVCDAHEIMYTQTIGGIVLLVRNQFCLRKCIHAFLPLRCKKICQREYIVMLYEIA